MEDEDYDEALIEAMLEGGNLTKEDLSKLEKQLLIEPDDLATRIRILGHYASKGRSDATRIRHVLWIINNRPSLSEFVVPVLDVHRSAKSEYDQVKAAWLEQVDKFPSSPKVLLNAAMFFRGSDEALVLKLLKQAQSIAPNDLKLLSDLAHHYRRDSDVPDSTKEGNLEALRLFEYILAHSEDKLKRFYQLTDVATTAFDVGDSNRASEVAQEMLRVAPQFKEDWNYGNAIYWANIVLGKIALSTGNVDHACDFLIKASETPGSPQLDSFGPEFQLCHELLLTWNKRECVKTYLSNCGKFWELNEGKIAKWVADLDSGLNPSFSRSCELS